MPDQQAGGHTLFNLIMRRLALLVLVFALLDVLIVVATYLHHPESLSQRLLNIEAERVATLADPAVAPVPAGIANWSAQFIRPGTAADADLIDSTRRERIDGGYRISGVRQVDGGGASRWLFLRFDAIGARPFLPVIWREVIDHVAVPLAPLSLLLLFCSIVSVRSLLVPLQRAEAEITRLDPDDMAMRLSVPAEPRELNTAIRAANHVLERVDASLTNLRDFTANAAHELRTPLSIMHLSLDRLPDSSIKIELQAGTDQMTRLVDQMLDMAQADAFVVDDPQDVDLAAVGRAVITQLAPKSFIIGRELAFDDLGNTVTRGHAEAIFRIYRNLIDNALLHAPSDTPIRISAGPGPQISVRDQGPGIPEADQPHLFKRFWRKNRSNSQGAGLGLGIVHRLVDAHSGSITVETPADGGALFRVIFPAAVQPDS